MILPQNISEIDAEINKRWGQPIYDDIVRGWFEYKETLVLYGEGEHRHYRNSVRPSTFFNAEDLNFAPRFWKIVPGLFVTVGLFPHSLVWWQRLMYWTSVVLMPWR